MTPTYSNEQLREEILKQALVKSEVVRWEKVSGEPVKVSNQLIVEIGIDDLMKLISQATKAAEITGYFKCKDEMLAHYQKYGNLNYYLAVAPEGGAE